MTNLDDIKAMLDAITPGEWTWDSDAFGGAIVTDDATVLDAIDMSNHAAYLRISTADAAFIAASPRIVRELVAEVERHRKVTALTTKVIEAMRTYHRTQTVEDAINLEDAVAELEAVK